MKKTNKIAIALLISGAVILAGAPSFAVAAETDQCVPQEYVAPWTEVVPDIEHPAVGEPTIEIDNPDYKPAVAEVTGILHHPAITEVVHHPAETEVVHHEAVTHKEYFFAKYVQERTRIKVRGDWEPWGPFGDWLKWSPETHTSWELSTDPLGTPQFHSEGSYSGTRQWQKYWQARYTSIERIVEDQAAHDETIVTKEAWDELVVLFEAWDETIIITPGTPAVGEPRITVPNPDYTPAWTEVVADIEHAAIPAVTCPEPEPEPTPTTPVVPPVKPEPTPSATSTPEPVAARTSLAQTGGPAAIGIGVLAAGLLASGAVVTGISRKRRRA